MSTDLDKLQGTWRITSLETDGRSIASSIFENARIAITGNTFTSVGMGANYEGTIELQHANIPKAFDLLFTSGPPKGKRNLGIYKLNAHRWTICLATRGDTRPRSFATKPGTGFALEILQRADGRRTSAKAQLKEPAATARKKVVATADVAESGPPTELEGEWQMVSGTFSGNPLDQAMVKWCTRVTRGNVTAVIAGPQTMLKARFTLDPSKRPAAIDYLNLEGASRGKSQAGIYEIDGGILKVCMAAPGRPRPYDFSSTSQDGRSLTTWRLAKP